MVKTASYLNNSRQPVPFVYFIRGNRCVFCGLQRDVGSTVNYAEDILTVISREERIDPLLFVFFDLQSYKGYEHPEGLFAFNQLEFKQIEEELYVTAWKPAVCPPEIVQLFQPFIGKDPEQWDGPYHSGIDKSHIRSLKKQAK